MSSNSYGDQLTITTFGESHGKALGVVIDGFESGFTVDFTKAQTLMNQRSPGRNALSTARREPDEIIPLSGLVGNTTTGQPVALLIRNRDARSEDYKKNAELFRPSHADYTYQKKWGIRDIRGGGRASARECAARVAAGALAIQALEARGVKIHSGTIRIGDIEAEKRDWEETLLNPLFSPDREAAVKMDRCIRKMKEDGDSIGGVIECRVEGLPAGLGEPVFDKLDALIGHALFSIPAVKGVEFGSGFESARMRGSEYNDPLTPQGFQTNHSGGVLGGISSSAPLVVKVAFKPTPSIAKPQQTVDIHNRAQTICVTGRHDPCVVPRANPIVKSMVALTLLDLWYRQFGRSYE